MSIARFPIASAATALLTAHVQRTSAALRVLDLDALASIERVLRSARDERRRVFTCGNGGSAAAALHLATDLALLPEPFDVQCLNGNAALLSALANDHGFEHVFARQLATQAQPGDVVVVISASGNSPNCIAAVAQARTCGATAIALVGFDGGRMLALSDLVLHVAVDDYRAAEDVHMVACHALATALAQ